MIFYNLPLKAYVIVSATGGIILAYIINKNLKILNEYLDLYNYNWILTLSRYLVIAYAIQKLIAKQQKVLSYVPSAVFPSLIFPAVFYDNGVLIFYSDEVLAFTAAVIISIIFKNIFLTVITGIQFIY